MRDHEGGQALTVRANGAHVCVVDDDPSLRRALHRLLQTLGFRVVTFPSAEDFLAADTEPAPDCLILDIHLGTLSGLDLHERLRASGRMIPTIFITGHDDAATRERARRAGAAGYVPKPLDEADLISAIETAVSRP
jgi:FixJ family two-component response regulator